MSRIGKKPIEIPEGVEAKIEDERVIIKGPKGELFLEIPRELKIELKEKELKVSPVSKSKNVRALWGLIRSLVFNMIKGAAEGFEKILEIHGVGYRASIEGNNLVLNIGFSHPVKIASPEGIQFSIEKNIITVSGIDKQLVGETAAKIRSVRPPEPYKGKGIRYRGEAIRRKAGKKAISTTT